MKHLSGLAFILAIFWVINSGHFDALLLSLGLLSILFVVFIMYRMEKVDGEFEPPIIFSLHLPFYLLWLLFEIIKSNIDVIKRVWAGPASISPTVIKVRASQKTNLCKVMYANSITMTPGTITLDIDGDMFEVHALTQEGADGVLSGEMDRRVSALEGRG